jgi:hypothetical protein
MRGWLTSSGVVPALAAAAALAGCGEDPATPRMFVSLYADWNDSPANAQAFGYTLTATLSQKSDAGLCAAPPAPVRFTIDDEEVARPDPDPVSGCIDFSVGFGPTLEARPTVTVRYELDGRLIATATFHRMMPGLDAMLAVPADGQVRAGDEVVVVPPPELPTSSPYARFYALDEAQASSWVSEGVFPAERELRLLDGIHVKVPPLAGRVALVFDGLASFLEADVTCDGFAACSGEPAAIVGPVYLTVQP